MELQLRYHPELVFRAVVCQQFDDLGIRYRLNDNGCVCVEGDCTKEKLSFVRNRLRQFGIEVVDDRKTVIVQQVKSAIYLLIEKGELPQVKTSAYLADETGMNYRTLSQIFSEVCHITIEHFIILCRIDRAKQLLTQEALSLTEISYRLKYSSVGHLSNQFKKVTGLTPRKFQKLIQSRRMMKRFQSMGS